MKKNGHNIITDKDITLTGNAASLGESLDDVIVNQLKSIKELKSNVKWLYKYGGTGSGSGTGVIGDGTGTWSAQVSFNGVTLSTNPNLKATIALNGIKDYNLRIVVKGSGQYGVSYKVGQNSQTKQAILSINNAWVFDLNFRISLDDIITITISDGINSITYYGEYFIKPYEFGSVQYYGIKEDGSGDALADELFESSLLKYDKIVARFNYNIKVETGIAYRWNEEETFFLDKANKYVEKEIFSNQQYTPGLITTSIKVYPENEEELTFSKSFNIWPDDLYLSVNAPAWLYKEKDGSGEPLNTIKSDLVYTFGATVIDGSVQNEFYNIRYNSDLGVTETQYRDREAFTIAVKYNGSDDFIEGWRTIDIFVSKAIDSAISKTFRYYAYVKKSNSRGEEYPTLFDKSDMNSGTSAQVLISKRDIIEVNSYIPQDSISYDFASYSSGLDGGSSFTSIGLLYSELNDHEYTSKNDGKHILKVQKGNNALTLWRDKAILNIGVEEFPLDIFLPNTEYSEYSKENTKDYHLITLVISFVGGSTENPYYKVMMFIDGNLEAEANKLSNANFIPNKLVLNSGTYKINYVGSYLTNRNIYNIKNNLHFRHIVSNWYWYASTFLEKTYSPQLLTALDNCKFDYKNSLIIVSEDFALGLYDQLEKKVPVMIWETSDKTSLEINNENYTTLEWMTKTYEVGNTSDNIVKYKQFIDKVIYNNVEISLKNTLESSEDSNINEDDPKFWFSVQGTSTLTNKSKNWEFGLLNDNSYSENKYVFSPNLLDLEDVDYNSDRSLRESGKEKIRTFLPESSFTLKSDVVDSGHSNNTVTGLFINENHNYEVDHGWDISTKYYKYLKKCLVGFPMILIVKIGDEYYFQGVYNFNLGRESYRNLGYYNPKNIENAMEFKYGGFRIFKMPLDEAISSNFIAAEVTDNSPYFDFSQSDESILFNSFNSSDGKMLSKLVYGKGVESTYKRDLSNFIEMVSKAGGYLFDILGKNFKDLFYDENGKQVSVSQQRLISYHLPKVVPDYRKRYKKEQVGNEVKFILNGDPIASAQASDLMDLIGGQYDGDENARESHLNYDSLIYYYLTVMSFGLVDSVQKNLNIKSWNGRSFGLYFYDMDTSYSKDNDGTFSVQPFVHSDYYASKKNEDGALIGSTIYRDFNPDKDYDYGSEKFNSYVGLDTPSSYLLAIAKYANHNLGQQYSQNLWFNKELITPQQIWSGWRRAEGCLRNAKYFMDTYYTKHLSDIPEFILNLNYVVKYFYEPLSIPSIAEASFSGRNIYRILNWLDKRFHILDLYFNIVKQQENISEGSQPVYLNIDNIEEVNNPDVIIKQELFSNGNITDESARELVGTVNMRFQTNSDYQPINIRNGSAYTSMLVDKANTDTDIENTFISTKSSYGGSSIWTKLSRDGLNSYLNARTGSSLTLELYGKYLKEVSTNTGKTLNNYILELPNLETLNLNSPTFIGNLSLQNYNKLRTVNISNSKIGLIIRDCPNVTSVSAENVVSSELTISGCKNLNNVNLRNTNIQQVTITYPTDLSLSGCGNKQIIISCEKPGGKLVYSNDDKLETVSLENFSNVKFENCPNLKSISFKDNNLETIEIVNCSAKASDLRIGDSSGLNEGIINLGNFIKLNTINFRGTRNFTKVILPGKDITLSSHAFYSCFELEHIDGALRLLLNGPNVFYDCNNFDFKNSNGNDLLINVTPTVKDIQYCFATSQVGKLTLEQARKFLNNVNTNVITNISYLFRNLNLAYTFEDFLNGVEPLKFSRFTKCTNAVEIAYNCGITFWHSQSFTGFGENDYELIRPFGNSTNAQISCLENFLFDVLGKVKTLHLSYNGNRFDIYEQQDSEYIKLGTLEKPVVLKNIFNRSNRILNFSSLHFNSGTYIDFKDTFSMFTAAKTTKMRITGFIGYQSVNGINLDGLFKNVKIQDMSNILTSVNSIDANGENYYVDLYNFINWDNVKNNLTSFGASSSEGGNSLVFRKQITYNNFQKIWGYLLSSKILVNVRGLFRECRIIGAPSSGFKLCKDDIVSTSITEIPETFYNCRLYSTLSSTTAIPMDISHDFLKPLPRISIAFDAFKGTVWLRTIPYDFFNKRDRKTNIVWENVEDIGNETKGKEYVYYEYRSELQRLDGCFASISVRNGSYVDLPNDPIPRPTLGGVVVTSTKTVYDINGSSITVSVPLEIQDLTLPKVGNLDFEENKSIYIYDNSSFQLRLMGTTTNLTRDNSALLDNHFGPFVAPDIFYGCSSNCSITGCFGTSITATDILTGYLPPNLLRKIKQQSLENTFNNINILPVLFKRVTPNGDNTITTNYYRFVPENFTNATNLKNAFNFRIRVPSGSSNIVNKVYFLSNKSISRDTESLENAFASTLVAQPKGSIGNYTEAPDYNFTEVLNSNLNLMYTDTSGLIEDGINTEYFRNLNYDKLINGDLSIFLSGSILKGDVNASALPMFSDSNYMINLNIGTMHSNHPSIYIKYPAISSEKKLINSAGNIKVYIFRNQLPGLEYVNIYSNIANVNILEDK